MKHSPEPWESLLPRPMLNGHYTMIIDSNGIHVATVPSSLGHKAMRANTRRIIACTGACKEISTADLQDVIDGRAGLAILRMDANDYGDED